MGNLNIDGLLAAAGKTLGLPPEKLREALSSGNYAQITEKLSEADQAKIGAVLKDPALSEKFRKQFMKDGQ